MLVASPWSFGYLRPARASNHFQRPQLGAARCRVGRTLFFSRLQRMFGKDSDPPRVSQRLELLLDRPVIAGHETDHHHTPTALQQLRTGFEPVSYTHLT